MLENICEGRISAGEDGEAYFRQFISDISKELKAGYRPCIYYKNQLDKLIELYGDNLEHSYNSEYSWWECQLKDRVKQLREEQTKKRNPRKNVIKRVDVSVEQVLELHEKGLNDSEIARRLNCSMHVVRCRLGKFCKE